MGWEFEVARGTSADERAALIRQRFQSEKSNREASDRRICVWLGPSTRLRELETLRSTKQGQEIC